MPAPNYPIIGGTFGLEDLPQGSRSHPPFLDPHPTLFCNASSALTSLLLHLECARIWLPSYLCISLVQSASAAGAEVRFYGVDERLLLMDDGWLDEVEAGDVVLLLDYFGFRFSSGWADTIRARGGVVLRDRSQALLSQPADEPPDFSIFSPRKFLGVPDGGVLTALRPIDWDGMTFAPPPGEWWEKALTVGRLRNRYDREGGGRSWFSLFQEVEASSPHGRFAMSDLSRAMILDNFDYREIARRRRGNYQVLLDGLRHLALYPALGSGVVPLGFPICVADRDRVRSSLFARGIYPPVHWPIDGFVPDRFSSSHRLSSCIMTLPCDQRYGVSDMERMTAALQEAAAESALIQRADD